MKYAFIKEYANQHRVVILCRALGVSKSGYYAWRDRRLSRRAVETQGLLKEIRRIHAEMEERYGSPRMHVELVARGHKVSRGRVERLMRDGRIQARQAKRYKRTYRHREPQVVVDNVLNRNFKATTLDEKWVSDIISGVV